MVSIGGEIGEVGKENSTEEELRAYLDGYYRELEQALRAGRRGHQQGQRPDRAPVTAACRCPAAASRRSSSTSARSSASARWRAHTASQVPCSTARRRCPTSSSTDFPAVETAEIHLATGFQNTLYEHPAFPKDLLDRDPGVVLHEHARRAQAGETDDISSSTRRARRRLARTSASCGSCRPRTRSWPTSRRSCAFLFDQLKVSGTKEYVARYVDALERHQPAARSRLPAGAPSGAQKGKSRPAR